MGQMLRIASTLSFEI
jgi:hypothetical protein